MQNKHLHFFRSLLFISFCVCSIMIGAQNPLNVKPSYRQMQMEMNTHLSIIDSITNVCSQEVTAIRNDVDTLRLGWGELMKDVVDMRTEMDSLSHNACNYISDKKAETNWNMWGVFLAFGSIIVMIIIYIKTYYNTKNQIIAQHKDTIKQIDEKRKLNQKQIDSQCQNTDQQIAAQRDLTQQQISEMQRQSEVRIASLEAMGNKIEDYTGKIKESILHFERTLIGKDDGKFIEKLISEIKTENEGLYQMISEDFVNLEDTSKADKNKYAQGVLKIKTNIDRIQNTLNLYAPDDPMPDFQAYLTALQKIDNGPDFDIMDEQLLFHGIGKTYCDEISQVATVIFNAYNATNTQAS